MATSAIEPALSPSEELCQFWNEVLEPKFIRFRHVLVGGLGLHSEAIFPKLAVSRGDTVLDVGCGFGDTALQLGERVGPEGCVLGIDCGRGFIEIARAEAKAAGDRVASFEVVDAQTAPFEPHFDHVFSRFGTMFFSNPVAALKNIRSALKPGGQLTMIVWRTLDDNPWLKLAKEVSLAHLPPPPEDGPSCGPGPFSMANQEMVTGQLRAAGFVDPIAFERIDAPIRIGHDVDDAIEFQLALGPAGEVYRLAGDAALERRDGLVAALREALAPYARADGVHLPSSSWMITARSPA